jgi:hypothetical protein
MIKRWQSLKLLALVILFLLLASCGTFNFTTELEQGDEGSGIVTFELVTPVAMQPAAGICPEGHGEVVTMKVNPDVPDPRCLQVLPNQRLAVVNGLDEELDISLGQLTATIEPGGEYTFEISFGRVLVPGVHYLGTSSCCGGEIFLKEEEGSKISEATGVAETPLPEFQGHLDFPYIAADAGNFSLQAGVEIAIIWVDAPLGAEVYEIRFIISDEFEEQLPMKSTLSAGGIEAAWLIPERVSGRLEGVALFTGGGEIRSGCCSQVFTGELPPDGICTLRIHGIGVQNLYEEASDGSPRLAGIAPGLYLEVLERTVDEWYLVKAESSVDSAASDSGDVTGWINGKDNVGMHGPCEGVPVVKD